MEVLAANAEHCRAIAEVHVESWQSAYRDLLPEKYLASLSVAEREGMWQRMVEQQPGHLLFARMNHQTLGFVAFGASRDSDAPPKRAEIYAIYVRPASWSSGAGRRLWREALRRIGAEGYESVGLWVMAGNVRAIRFYECAGFVLDANACKPFELAGVSLKELRYVCQLGPTFGSHAGRDDS